MKTSNLPLTFACPFCLGIHSIEDECDPRETRQSTRDRKRREKSEHESRLYAGLSQMEGGGR